MFAFEGNLPSSRCELSNRSGASDTCFRSNPRVAKEVADGFTSAQRDVVLLPADESA